MLFGVNETVVSKFLLHLTIWGQIHASELDGSHDLSFEVSLVVDKDGGEVAVGVVGDAGGGDTAEELCGRKLGSQLHQVLVDQRTQWDARREGDMSW